jgi:hypothetical protein
MPTTEQDWNFFRGGVAELEPYLLSDELFWRMEGSRTALPRLTIGGLLLAEMCLKVRMDTPDFLRLEQDKDRICSKWRSAWERKAGREVRARLDLWRNYLVDFRQAPDAHADAYPQEVRWRVILSLLVREASFSPAEKDELDTLDKVLRASFMEGKFLWEETLVPAFPIHDYWYLYGSISPLNS